MSRPGMDTGIGVTELADAVPSTLSTGSKVDGKFITGSGNIPTGTYAMAPTLALLAAISFITLR